MMAFRWKRSSIATSPLSLSLVFFMHSFDLRYHHWIYQARRYTSRIPCLISWPFFSEDAHAYVESVARVAEIALIKCVASACVTKEKRHLLLGWKDSACSKKKKNKRRTKERKREGEKVCARNARVGYMPFFYVPR